MTINKQNDYCFYMIIIADKCIAPLGMEDNKIADDQLTASSEWSSTRYHGVKNARLNRPSQPDSTGAWCAAGEGLYGVGQWVQVDLRTPTWITGVRLQVREDLFQFVTQYKVEYSSNMQNWMYVQSSGDQEAMVS